jgi:myosin heavy subunit
MVKTMKKEEFVKLGISEELAAECEKASLKELESFIPKSRFDEVNDAKKTAEALVKTRDEQIETLKNSTGDVDSLKKQIEDLQKENKDAADAHAAEIKKLKIDSAVDTAIINAKGKNAKAIKALLNLDNAELDEDGTIKGLAEQMTALQKSDEYLFEAKQTKTVKGAKPGETGKDDGDGKVDTSKMTYSELTAYMAENPDAKID